jgi:hypothetical protein
VGLGAVALVAACGVEPKGGGPEVGVGAEALVVGNGISLNGISLNGISLNGISLNGISLNGISLNGISLNGISLNGTSLNGISLNGISLNGTDFTGALVSGQLSDGTGLALRIDGITVDPDPANSDLLLYAVSYQTTSGWSPLCGSDPATGMPVRATAVAGRWNYQSGVPGGGSPIPDATAFTFACLNSVIAKCLEAGYKPWVTRGGVPLGDHHTACTRLLRADYCGDGTANTVNGTPVNLYDDLAIQTDSVGWPFEAEWGTQGARCVKRPRFGDTSPRHLCPGRNLHQPRCGALADFATGTLLMSESQENED